MLTWKNTPLAIASHLADTVEALAAAPRPRFASVAGAKPGLIELVGVLDPDYLTEWRRDLLALAADDSVSRIVMLVDSPGGLTFGVPETAAVVRRVAKTKRIDVVAENYLCSGAYWIASQATTITATPSAWIGSLGVMIVLLDESAAAEAMGVKVLTIASSPGKGVGVPGAPVEPEHVAALRRLVDYTTAQFAADVERGRKLKPAKTRELFSGEVWHGGPAQHSGLIDRVALVEDELAAIAASQVGATATLKSAAAVTAIEKLIDTAWSEADGDAEWNAVARGVLAANIELAKAARAAGSYLIDVVDDGKAPRSLGSPARRMASF